MRTKLFLALLLFVSAVWWESIAAYAQNDQASAQTGCPRLVPTQPAEGKTYTIEPNTYFVKNQAILIGLPEDVETVLDALPPTLEVEPLRGITDNQFLGRKTIQLIQSGAGNTEQLVTEIYTVIFRLLDEQGLQQVVYVDFNYWTDLAQHGVHGAPHSVGAHPFGSMADATLTAAFHQQWAFTAPHGVGLLAGTTGTRLVATEGTPATHVAIFDTSPYVDPGLKVIPDIDVPGQADKDGLVICVFHPDLPELAVDHTGEAPIDVRDHGLFVAGLVHAVAPGVSLDLIKTLNEQGHGHLFWLLEALALYLDDALSSSSRGTLQGTVINLSLSVDSPPTTTMPAKLVDQINGFISRVGYPALPTGALPIFTLQQVLEAAYNGGATIVAAAGNEASPTTMQTPAAYTFVIGAAATSMNGSRSCFSNLGDVGAPGGDGDSSSCDPNVIRDTTQCNPSFCPYGIISLVVTDPTPGSEQYGYAYWLGTSFSTPLVSGIAALRHENLAPWGLRGDWHAFFMQWLLEAAACNSSSGRLLTLQAGVDGIVGVCPP